MAEAVAQVQLTAGELQKSGEWILVPPCGSLTVRKKLRSHDSYKDAEEDRIAELMRSLSDEATMKKTYFGHLLQQTKDSIQEAVEEASDFPEGTFLTQQELGEAAKRAEERFARVCSLPMKLVLTKIGEGGTGSKGAIACGKKAAMFASCLNFPFGAHHGALMVGDVLLEWDTTSLVIPKCQQVTPVFQASLDGFSSWNRSTSRYKAHMKRTVSDSDKGLDFNNQVEIMLIIEREKELLIDDLVREIVRYNKECRYNLCTCNCQHFILHAMKTIRVFELPRFTGQLRKYFDNLRKGRYAKRLKEFRTHKELDQYVRRKIKTMEQGELDYLHCVYVSFHLEAGIAHPSECSSKDCQMARLEELVDTRQRLQHKFTDS